MTDVTVIDVLVPSQPAVVEAQLPGIQGPKGDDPRLEPIQNLGNVSGVVQIDYALGWHCRAHVTGDVIFTFKNWPADGRLARLSLKLDHDGTNQITFPSVGYWEGGPQPVFNEGDRTWIIIATDDGGATLDGFVSGLAHQSL